MDLSVKINSHDMKIKEYQGKRVVTLKDIDAVHGRTEGTASNRFKANRKHFIEGVDYYKLMPCDNSYGRKTSIENGKVQKYENHTLGFNVPNRGLILITETGYLMLVKSFTDELAWRVQRELVSSYFNNVVQLPPQQVTFEDAKPIVYKNWNGKQVLTITDLSKLTGATRNRISHRLRDGNLFIPGEDYTLLQYPEMKTFKDDNPGMAEFMTACTLITKNGVQKFLQYEKNTQKSQAVKLPVKCAEFSKDIDIIDLIAAQVITVLNNSGNSITLETAFKAGYNTAQALRAERTKIDVTEIISD